jgi:hypothetical protein
MIKPTSNVDNRSCNQKYIFVRRNANGRRKSNATANPAQNKADAAVTDLTIEMPAWLA